jgi:endonuclease G
MKKTTTLAAATSVICSLFVTGCILSGKEPLPPVPPLGKGGEIKFASTITRAYNNVWEPGDRIGVYMLPATSATALSATQSEAKTAPLAENKLYTHASGVESETVTFVGMDEENILTWPEDGTAVDFTAYYPYLSSEEIPGAVYPIDISDQSSPQEIDLMYSANVRGVSEGTPALVFEHKLPAVEFRLIDLDGASLDGMTASIEGLPSKASLDLVTGTLTPDSEAEAAPFSALLSSTSDGDPADEIDDDGTSESAIVKALVLPGEGLDYRVVFTLPDEDCAVFSLEGVTYESGKRYIYDITISSAPAEGVGFGAQGESSSITDWVEVKDPEVHNIIKNDDGGSSPAYDGRAGAPWLSGVLVATPANPSLYSVAGNARTAEGAGLELSVGNPVTITKDNYQSGITSVTLSMSVNYGIYATIRSVKVGGVALFDKDGKAEVRVEQTGGETRQFVFTPGDGEPLSGTVEITVEGGSGKSYISQFGIN